MTTAIAISPDKTVEEIEVHGLRDLQGVVRGLIEAVTLDEGSTLYVNEEGRYVFDQAAEFNSIATDVAGLGGRVDVCAQGIIGPAILVGPAGPEGEETDVTKTGRRWVERVRREATR